VYFVSVGEITTRAADGSTISVYRDGDAVGLLEVIYDVRRIGTAIASKNT
jgi:hyperpolarization activated cyclic nucleotide-gated potassium channel 2